MISLWLHFQLPNGQPEEEAPELEAGKEVTEAAEDSEAAIPEEPKQQQQQQPVEA